MERRKKLVKKIVLWALVVACMVMIFSFSAQNADESIALSNSVLDRLLKMLMVNADDATISFLSVFIRKVAHFLVYALLGGLSFLALREHNLKGGWRVFSPWAIATVYAVTDEIHQRGVLGRSGQLKDVLIDSSGALFGIMVLFIGLSLLRRCKK